MHTIPVPKKLGKNLFRNHNDKGERTYCALGWICHHTGYAFTGMSSVSDHLKEVTGIDKTASDIWSEYAYPAAVANDHADRYSKRVKILRDFVDKCPNLVMEDD